MTTPSSSSRGGLLTSTLPLSPASLRATKKISSSRLPRLPHLPLVVVRSAPAASASVSSSSSYNGWADLAAAPDSPFFPLPLSGGLTLLLLLPASALALSRLPPLPLLAAAFAAGFAARHLSSSPTPQPHRLAADLDALRAHLAAGSSSDPAALIQAVDRLRDAVRLQPNNTVLGDVAKDLAGCCAAWARDTLRDLTSPRGNKPKDSDVAAITVKPAPASSAAVAAAKPQQQDSRACESALDDMLPFDNDAHGRQDKLGDGRLERLVLKHRHGARNDHFQAAATFATESMESSSLLERTLEIRDRSYRFKIQRRDTESQVTEEAREGRTDDDDRFVGDNATSLDPMYDEAAATDLDGEEFTRSINEAAEILRQARECMIAGGDEEATDALLYKSARLLSTAVALRPTSLVAVGQLGNTYLLHGELKLKISRELRTLLANSGALLNGRDRVPRSRKLDTRILSRDNISSALVDVCEECESLLVEAGRTYRTALSIDSADLKALYNWGLALIFRAQLLADIGPEAAVDADRVYLAAIDKFDAMLSKSNTYAPEALYRWGVALQQRSHLRPQKNKEKIRLLEQAKSLFEDVLYVEADNKVVREALSSCISELNYHGRWL